MRETGRCLSPASKARPKRSSHSGTSRSIAARGDSMAQVTWRAVLIGSCLGGVLSSPGKCLAIDNQLGSLLQHIEGKGAINVGD
jgi:hypothetical protein